MTGNSRFFNWSAKARVPGDIAEQLHLSPKTVDVHRGNIREKLHLKDITALVRYAVRWLETQNPAS